MELTPKPTRLMTIREATAAGYGSKSSLYRDIQSGMIQATRIGGRLRILESSLQDAVERGLVKQAAE